MEDLNTSITRNWRIVLEIELGKSTGGGQDVEEVGQTLRREREIINGLEQSPYG